MFINVEFYYEQKKKLVFASLFAAVLNLVLNWIFIPIFGYVAAAYTTLFSYFIFAVSNYISMKMILKEKNVEDNIYDYVRLILLFLALLVFSFVGVILYPYLLPRLIAILTGVFILCVNSRNIIGSLAGVFKNNDKT